MHRGLKIEPCIPKAWDGFEVTRVFRGATYHITVKNPRHACRGVSELRVNGQRTEGNVVPAAAAGARVEVEVTLG